MAVETGENMTARSYADIVNRIPSFGAVLQSETTGVKACIVEFVLEGLHLHKLLNKYTVSGKSTYSA